MDRGEVRWARRELRRARIYAVSPDEILNLLEAQEHLCLVCGEVLRLGRGGMALDHDHRPGLPRFDGRRVRFDGGPIRGILCMPCNTRAGRDRDDPRRSYQRFLSTGNERDLWLARYLVHTDAAEEWVPTQIPLVRDEPLEAGWCAVTWRAVTGPAVREH
jgi:recombination endonuclease VII